MARKTDQKGANRVSETIVLLGFVAALAYIALAYRLVCRPRGHPGKDVRQKAQFHSIEAAIELFNNEFEGYPPSDANDLVGQPYCGAMKLAEALMGQDMLGFHGDSVFRADGKDANGIAELYRPVKNRQELQLRRGPYLPPESADSPTLAQIYGQKNTGSFGPNSRVLCDEYPRKHKTGLKAGMPVLYYKADTSKAAHDIDNPDNPENIYDYRDNHALLALGVPGEPDKKHPMFADPKLFYRITRSDKVTATVRPFRPDTFILISAGPDGLYGTKDDICNFEFNFPDE